MSKAPSRYFEDFAAGVRYPTRVRTISAADHDAFCRLVGYEVPLFLDDPLVHVDPERTQNILTVLARFATNRQLFYLTQDPRVPEWLNDDPDVRIIPLQ